LRENSFEWVVCECSENDSFSDFGLSTDHTKENGPSGGRQEKKRERKQTRVEREI